MRPAGCIERRYYVVCGGCVDSKQIEGADSESHSREIVMNRMGYTKHRRKGWLCPKSYEELTRAIR